MDKTTEAALKALKQTATNDEDLFPGDMPQTELGMRASRRSLSIQDYIKQERAYIAKKAKEAAEKAAKGEELPQADQPRFPVRLDLLPGTNN